VAIILNQLKIDFRIITIGSDWPKKRNIFSKSCLFEIIFSILSNVQFLRIIKQRKLPKYPQEIYNGGRPSGKKLLIILDKIKPDYIFLFSGNLISSKVIGKASKGVINIHPGLLPWLRGTDVVKHALLRDLPIGVTSHYIDDGLDTGDIITRYLLPINKDESLNLIKVRLNQLICATFVELALTIVDNKRLYAVPQNKKFNLCRKTNENENKKFMELRNKNNAYFLYKRFLGSKDNIKCGNSILEKYKKILDRNDLITLL
jgi:methionyl-tRNA formyltransferase